ncbi:MAG TPA: arginine N-succinyltransferase [Tepidisphaeraceae bacterium]|nr:arginine N-succinyltransferase [Tepidisphaeraceae bacterium]
MLVIRPITLEDLDQLFALVSGTGFGLTSLPPDRELLHQKIVESQESFARLGRKPRGDSYLFVLEDLKTGKAVGTTGIVSKVGGFEPFYAYKIETAVAESEALRVRKEVRFLELVADHNGPCEVGSLFLSPDYRQHGNGRLLSLVRFLFMAEHPKRFDPVVISELRGIIDDKGHSPFWEALGRHFFQTDYPKADYLSGIDKKFIADLMPTHPIYIPLLSPEGQAAVGKVHPQSKGALEILKEEGFRENGMVDIFDAGPVVSCQREDIRTVRESRRMAIAEIVDELPPLDVQIIAAARKEFRACKGPVQVVEENAGVRILAETAMALQVKVGDVVRFIPMRAALHGNDEVKPV